MTSPTPPLSVEHAITVPQLIAKLSTASVLLQSAVDRSQDFTGDRLQHEVTRIGQALTHANVGRQDAVAIVLPNGPAMAVAFLATASHCAAAPLNPAYNEAEIGFYLDDMQARAVIVSATTPNAARAAARQRNLAMIEIDQLGVIGPAAETAASLELPNSDDIALILHTSGTTARPKQVPLTHANLLASARAVATSLQLTADDKALNVMPLFHIHGIVGVLLASLYAGASVICTSGFEAEQFTRLLRTGGFTWYSAVPTIHQSVVEACSGENMSGHQLRLIRSSSAALAPAVMAQLESCFGVPVIEAYGMTEAAHQMASNPLPPAVRKPGSVGLAAGPQIQIVGDSGRWLASGETGEVVILGSNVMRGYVNNDDANRNAFFEGWFRTGDQGYLDADGYLFLTGRLKEIINRAGEKISPREVDEALLEHPAVRQAVTFAVPHPTIGEDIAAAVVLQSGQDVAEATLREWLFERLAAMKVPSRIIFVSDIPKGSTGKIQRLGLHQKLAAHLEVGFIAATSPLEQHIAAVWSEVLGIPLPGVVDNFFASGGDSLRAMRVVSRLREAYSVDIEATLLFRMPTIATLATQIELRIRQREEALLAYVSSLTDEEVARLLEEGKSA